MKSPIELYLVFDLETTGLKVEDSAVCEIACCVFDSKLNDVKEYSSGIIKPYGDKKISQGALNANGVTIDQLNSGRDSGEVAEEFVAFIKSLKKTASKTVLVGQNIDKFDIPHLDDFLSSHGKDLSKLVNSDITFDTLWWARMKWEELPNFKLGTLCSEAGISLVDAHRALNDTRATKELAKYFLRGLRGESTVENKEKRVRPRVNFEF